MNRLFYYFSIYILCAVSCACNQNANADTSDGASRLDSSSVTTSDDASTPKAKSLTFALTGDMMLGTNYPESPKGAFLPADSGKQLLKDCIDIIRNADVAAGNLEGVLGMGGKAKACNNPSLCFTFRMPEYMADRLVEAGFDYMNLANNHMGDFGVGGLQASMNNLKKAGIAFGGVKNDAPYAIIERNGLKIGFTGFSTHSLCPSVHDYNALKNILAEMRPKCDIIVVSMHAGGEGKAYTHVPKKAETFHGWQRGDVYKFAHTAIDNGADIVWGQGPHVMRGAELYNDRLILYSLGNFCTPYKFGLSGISGQSCLAEITVDAEGKFEGGKLHSYLQGRGTGPRTDAANGAAKQIRSLSNADFPSSPLKIEDDGTLGHK